MKSSALLGVLSAILLATLGQVGNAQTTVDTASTMDTSTTAPATSTNPVTTAPATTNSTVTTVTGTSTNLVTTVTGTSTNPVTTVTGTSTNPVTTVTGTSTNPVTTVTGTSTNPVTTVTGTTNNTVTTVTGTSDSTLSTVTQFGDISTEDSSAGTELTTDAKNITTTKPDVKTTVTNPAPSTTCVPNICGDKLATCIQLNKNYTCRCPLNFYYENLTCIVGSSFYGVLTLTEVSFDPQQNSESYTNVYFKIKDYFQECFQNFTNYTETVINSISAADSQLQSRNTDTVNATVIHMFTKDSNDESFVRNQIEEFFKDRPEGYSNKNICDGFYCDKETTSCTETGPGQLPQCFCLQDRYAFTETFTSCRACNPDCNSESKHCIQASANAIPQCVCKPGYKSDSSQCKECSFGTSGDECKDNALLILVIVGAVGGAVLIALLGAVIGVSVKSNKRKSDEHTELINDDSRSSPVIGGLFPKVHAKLDEGHVNRAGSPYEITNEYTKPIPKRDYDEDPWYEMSKRERKY